MEYTINDVTDVAKEVTVTIPAADLQSKFEEAYKTTAAQVEIKGFRKGKVPMGLIKQRFGEAIEYDAISGIANDTFKEIVEKDKLEPIGDPSLSDVNYKRGSELKFTVKYEVKPVVTLGEYKNIPVEKIIHEVTDLEIEEEIDRIRKANMTTAPAERADGDQYIITADIQELDDNGTVLLGKRRQDMKINLSDANLYAEIRQALTASAVGDVKRASFDVSHGDHSHKNNLEITVKGVEKISLPEFTDEFVKTLTKDQTPTADEFRDKLRADLAAYWIEQSERRLSDDIVSEIVKRHTFGVPETLVKAITDSRLEEMAQQNKGGKLPAGFDETRFRKDFHDTAVFQAKWFLLRDEIVKKENITADDADLEHKAEEDAPSMGIDKERLLSFYKTSQMVKDNIITERLMTFLKGQAQISEVDDRKTLADPATT